MQIEAERGWMPSCYTCLMFEDAGPAFNSGVRANFNDFRNLVGLKGQTTAISTTAIRHGLSVMNQQSTRNLLWHDDYVLRAHAFAWAGPTANSKELLEAFDTVVEQMWIPGGTILESSYIGTVIYDWGGYAYTPGNAHSWDQVVTVYYGLSAALLPGAYRDALAGAFEADAAGWSSVLATTPPPYPSFAEYLQQQPTWQVFRQ